MIRSRVSFAFRPITSVVVALASLALPNPAAAQTSPSLWLGTNNTSTRDILNVTPTGSLIRQINTTEATGIAVDNAGDRLYVGTSTGVIRTYNLTSLALISTVNGAVDRKSTRLNSSHSRASRMPSSA